MLLVGVLTYLVPQSIGLGAGGFDSQLTISIWNFYDTFAVTFFLMFIAFAISFIIKAGDKQYGSSVAFADLGESPALSLFGRFSQLQFGMLSTFVLGVVGLFVYSASQVTFTGLISLEQQFTPTAQLLFSSLLIPGAENMGLALVIATSMVLLRVIARATKMSGTTYVIMARVFVPMAGGLYWIINHLLRYASQDFQLTSVFVFGYLMSLLIVLTGSFVIGYIMHIMNNFFFDVRNHFSSDNVTVGVIAVLVGLGVLYGIIYRKSPFGKGGR